MPKRRRAYQQGDLDGLCGVYSIVNALRYVFHLRDEQCQTLFAKLVKALEQDCGCLHRTLLKGMHFPRLKRLADVVSKCHLQDRNVTFQVRRLRLKRDQRSLPHLWAVLERELGPRCVAIVGVTGATDHWCVVYRVTAKTLWLLDSSGQTQIHRSRCTVRTSAARYCLDPSEILLIER